MPDGGKYKWVCPKMDSQLASVLTSGSLDVQNGSQCAEGSGPVTEVFLDQEEKTSAGAVPGNPKPCPVKAAVTIRQDAVSINGKKPEVGGTSKPASQESSNAGGCRQPITVKTGVPVSRRRPIRLKIVVPPRCKRPINSAISLTKDFAHLHFRRSSSGAVSSEENKIQISAVKTKEVRKVTNIKTEERKLASFQETEADRHVMGAKIHTDGSETPLISNTNTFKTLSRKCIKEETKEREIEENIPLILREIKWTSCKTSAEETTEEQTEPLDLSLPKKKESRETRCGRFMGDSGCESSLIMEVDEYEGEGDRDVVEEDDVGELGSPDTLEDSLLSPSFFSTSVLTSLSSIETDTENLLLIDDQGIPYTLSPDGLKVPQVDASTSDDPLSESGSAEVKGKESPPPQDPNLSQSSDNALKAPSCPSPAPAADPPSLAAGQVKTPEVFTSLVPNSEPSSAAESSVTCVQASAVLSASAAISVPPLPIQILTNPSSNAPILLLSSSSSSPQLSTSQMGLTLPLPVTPTVPGTSTPMFLLLSSVPSSFGDSASTSTPIAVLDPTTGQLSQITAASAPVSLPLPSGQVSTLGSPLPTLSHPIIKLSPNNPPVILPGVNNLNSDSVLASSPAVQNDSSSTPLLPSQNNSSDSNSGSEAISAAEVVSSENNKPSTFTETSLHPQSVGSTPSEAQSPASDTQFEQSDLHSQHLPLDDHLYFASAAAPASPPDEPALSSDKLPPLDPLGQMDPLSPGSAANAMGPRRVLYCQLCPRVFFYLSDLERHAITHSQKKPHVCQQCGKAFKRSSHLQRHKHIHTGQRNFVCPICSKRFREAGELQRHQRVHTGEKPYQCQLCHTRFAERNTLRRHTKRKHPYHQVAMEMLSERRGSGGGGGGASGVQEEEESAEWYSSTVSNLDNSESEAET